MAPTGVHVAECYDVGVAVQFRDSGDLVLFGGIGLAVDCAGSAVWIDDGLPLDLGVGFDCCEDVAPGGCVGVGVEIEREGDE